MFLHKYNPISHRLVLPLIFNGLCLILAINGFAADEGFVVAGVFTQQIRNQNTTNTFKAEVDGNRYNILIGPPGGTKLGDMEVASDGTDVYEVIGIDALHTTHGLIMKGTVSPGTIPSSEVFGNDAICQILWLAYASSGEISEHGPNSTNLIPNLIFQSEDQLPWWDININVDATLGMGSIKLPSEIDFTAPNYILLSKSDFPPNAVLIPSSILGKYKADLAAPFTNGYLIARYLVTEKTNYNGYLIPGKFQFFRFSPSFKAQTSNDLDVVNTYEGTVLKCSSLTGDGISLPPLKSESIIQDHRLIGYRGTWPIYLTHNGKWLTRKDKQFQIMLQANLSHAKGEDKSSYVFFKKILVLITLFLILPGVFIISWLVLRKR